MLHQGPRKRNWFESWEVKVWYIGGFTPPLYLVISIAHVYVLTGRVYDRYPWDASHHAYYPGRVRSGETFAIWALLGPSSMILVPSVDISHRIISIHSDHAVLPLRARSFSYLYPSCQGRRCRPGCCHQTNNVLQSQCKQNFYCAQLPHLIHTAVFAAFTGGSGGVSIFVHCPVTCSGHRRHSGST